jgi:N-glycosylase/DNA lyase
MPRLEVQDFSLRHTIECGQFFRWLPEDGGYKVRHLDREFHVRQDGDRLHYSGAPAGFIRRFFSLDHDLPAIARSIDRDRGIHAALDRYWGLRLIRQDPWECTASFITSIASNIPRITRNIHDMAAMFGRDRRFPAPAEMGGEEALRLLRLGFRSKYLAEAARLAGAGLLDEIGGMPTGEARETLMVIPGVGVKVADCILLFAFGRLDAFPVDTWIRKTMIRLYFEGQPVGDQRIRRFAASHFGRYAGYAQQYLYIHARESRKATAPCSPAALQAAP